MTPEAVLFVGIQATGKSTFFQQRFARSHVRINYDTLRTRRRERILFEACLTAGISFVVDNTNPTRDDRRRYLEPIANHSFRSIGYFFQSQIKPSLKRNSLREGKERIPERGLLATYAKMEIPDRDEGFDELYYVKIGFEMNFVVESWAP